MTGEDEFDELLQMPPETAAELDRLLDRRLAARRRIVELLAEDAGLGALAELPPAARLALEETVEEACEDWHVAPARAGAEGRLPAHARLLRDYHALGDAILGMRETMLRQVLGPVLRDETLPEETVWRQTRR